MSAINDVVQCLWAIQRPRTSSAAVQQMSNAHERHLVTNENVYHRWYRTCLCCVLPIIHLTFRAYLDVGVCVCVCVCMPSSQPPADVLGIYMFPSFITGWEGRLWQDAIAHMKKYKMYNENAYVYMSMYKYVYMWIYKDKYLFLRVRVCISMYAYIYVYEYVHMCVYIHMYAYTWIYIYE